MSKEEGFDSKKTEIEMAKTFFAWRSAYLKTMGTATDAQLTALEGAIKHLDSALCCLEDYTNATEEK